MKLASVLCLLLLLGALPAQAKSSHAQQFINRYEAAIQGCGIASYQLFHAMHDWRGGPTRYTLEQEAQAVSTTCAYFMNEDPPILPAPKTRNEQRFVNAEGKLRSDYIAYAFFATGCLENYPTDTTYCWLANNTWNINIRPDEDAIGRAAKRLLK